MHQGRLGGWVITLNLKWLIEKMSFSKNYVSKNVVEPSERGARSTQISKYKIPITSGEKC